MKRLLTISLASLILSGHLYSQGTTTGLSQLRLPYAPRPAALGEAVVGEPGQVTSLLINPSSVRSADASAIAFSHTEWIQDIRSEFLSASVALEPLTLAFHVLHSGIPGIEVREQPGPPVGTFTAQSAAFGVTAATDILEPVTVGVTLKYLYEKIYVDQATGFAFDIGGTVLTPVNGLSAGIALTNVGSMGAFRSERDDLPSQLRLGAAYTIEEESFKILLYPSILHNFIIETNHLQLGTEVVYEQTVALRVGYQTGFDARGLSAGVGFRYGMFAVDYAFVPFSASLGSAHLASVGVSF